VADRAAIPDERLCRGNPARQRHDSVSGTVGAVLAPPFIRSVTSVTLEKGGASTAHTAGHPGNEPTPPALVKTEAPQETEALCGGPKNQPQEPRCSQVLQPVI